MTSPNSRNGDSLRALASRGPLMVPSVYDALGARAARQAGFEAISVSGNGVSASLLGLPDMGVLTMTEMVEHTRRIVESVEIPVIADGDTGYGGPLNVFRTVRSYEAAGAAAVHIEDQAAPKRCAYLPSDIRIVPLEEGKKRLAAALEARSSEDFLIIARTDARNVLGFDETVKRCAAYAEAGADWVFCAALGSLEEAEEIAAEVSVPLMVNMNLAGALGDATDEELGRAGIAIALYPSVARNAAVRALTDSFAALRRDGSQRGVRDLVSTPREYDDLLDADYWQELDRRLG